MWKYVFSDQHNQPGKITSQVLVLIWIFSCCVLNGVTCGIFLALITVVEEIMIEKSVMHMW